MSSTYGLQLLTPPTGEPVDLAKDIKAQLRIPDFDAENGLLTSWMIAARELVEEITGRQVMQAQYLLTTDAFPGRRVDELRPSGWRFGVFRLPKPPLISVDTINYVDPNGTLTLLDPSMYQVDVRHVPGLIRPARLQIWPITDPFSLEAVQITFTCGWASVALVPERVKAAIRMIVAHLYQHREASVQQALSELPLGAMSFLRSLRFGEYR